MRFGQSLEKSVYPPWKDSYIDYKKLKALLYEPDEADGRSLKRWTDEDEGRFVDELVNTQLEKVHAFYVSTYESLRDRVSACENRLEPVVIAQKEENSEDAQTNKSSEHQETLHDVQKELDAISGELKHLEQYSRINYTGFLKAAKKHDRRQGSYRIRPLLQVRLAALPFNQEDYSPLLYQLSVLYTFVREQLGSEKGRAQSTSETRSGNVKYTAHKFFVHPDNLLEVKTYILRHLPVLVYNPNTSRVADGNQGDPTLTSLYFDNPKFSLYNKKLDQSGSASSLRLRWYGQLADQPEIAMEKKTVSQDGDSEEVRINLRDKQIVPFLKGEYKLDKAVKRLRERFGEDSKEANDLERATNEIKHFIQKNDLQPVLRANYSRTAFQIPGEDRVRISIDTNLAFIREDAIDQDRPCRDPWDWHRDDIDKNKLEYPFDGVRKGEIARFPYAVLEVKVRDGLKKKAEWIEDLMSSHLVREAPRFSKFVHGAAQLFEDYLNSFPFWLSLLDTDIRQDPGEAFRQEQEKKAKQADDEIAVGSFVGSFPASRQASSYRPAVSSPVAKSTTGQEKASPKGKQISFRDKQGVTEAAEELDSDEDNMASKLSKPIRTPGLKKLFPSFSTSKYGRAKRGEVQLPPGVRHPGQLIKDSGPVRVEPKVWLANQRTFIKWEHVAVLLASLSLSLYNGAGRNNPIAQALAVVYTLIAIFTAGWGWWMYIVRSNMIRARSGDSLDSYLGPVVVCASLAIALVLNLIFKYNAVMAKRSSLELSAGLYQDEL